MAFIDTYISEGGLPGNITNLFLSNGWTQVNQFMKVVYDASISKPNVTSFTGNGDASHQVTLGSDVISASAFAIFENGTASSVPYTVSTDGNSINLDLTGRDGNLFEIYKPSYKAGQPVKVFICRHDILENASGMMYGIAIAGWVSKPLTEMPFAVKDNGTWELRNDSFIDDAVNKFATDYADRSTIYVYQLADFTAPTYEDVHLPWNNTDDSEMLKLVLDCEVWAAAWNKQSFEIKTSFPNNMQSPIVEVRLRLSQIEELYDTSVNSVVYRTNWWLDSQIRVKGMLDKSTAMLILSADTAPMWEGNTVPSVPLYMGDFDMYANSNNGTMSEVINRSFKFDLTSGGSSSASITTAYPCLEDTNSYVDIYLVGDFSSDPMTPKFAILNIDGSSRGVSSNKEVLVIPATKTDPTVTKITYPLFNIAEKTTFKITFSVTPSVSVARVWLDFRIDTHSTASLACLWAGTAFTDKTHFDKSTVDDAIKTSAGFDPDDPSDKKFRPVLQPYLKNYLIHPSNGVDSVMVKQTKYGAMYQAYHIVWEQPSNDMPPKLINDVTGQKFPRAWQQPENKNYGFTFNPSRYSEKIHSSKAYLLHPELGVHGSLRGVILMPPLSILDGDELREKVGCDMPIMYHYHLVEGISPLTKRPSTQYRPAGLGIRITPFSE